MSDFSTFSQMTYWAVKNGLASTSTLVVVQWHKAAAGGVGWLTAPRGVAVSVKR